MTAWKRTLAWLVLVAGLSGCYKISYHYGPTTAPTAPPYQEWHHIGIFALIEFSQPVQLHMLCPSGFSHVEHEVSVANAAVVAGIWILSANALAWLYFPHTVRVYCNSGQAYRLHLDPGGDAVAAEGIGFDEAWVSPGVAPAPGLPPGLPVEAAIRDE
jgi:hypothetical protein